MIITDRPVDVAALRRDWIVVVDHWAYFGAVDKKTQRVARRTCFASIATDMQRYAPASRLRLFAELFEDAAVAAELEMQLKDNGPEAAASWLEEWLGVELVNREES